MFIIIIFASFFRSSAGLAQPPVEAIFYYVNTEDSYQSLEAHIRQISILAPQAFKMDAQGAITGDLDPRALALAKQHNVPVMPLVVNPGFDEQIIHSVLQDSAARTRAISSLLALCQKHHFQGIQFDFEHIHVSYRDAYTQFVREAAAALRPKGYLLSAALFPRTSDAPGDSPFQKWYFDYRAGAFDYKALAEAADFLSIMTYDQHSSNTPPGPVAGLPWMERVIEYVLSKIPAQKFSLGIPLYSYHWFPSADLPPVEGGISGMFPRAKSTGRGLSFANAMTVLRENNAAAKWDERNQIHLSYFERGDVFEYIFLEDGRSFRAKFDLVNKYGLRGFSSWRLGLEDPAIWETLANLR